MAYVGVLLLSAMLTTRMGTMGRMISSAALTWLLMAVAPSHMTVLPVLVTPGSATDDGGMVGFGGMSGGGCWRVGSFGSIFAGVKELAFAESVDVRLAGCCIFLPWRIV